MELVTTPTELLDTTSALERVGGDLDLLREIAGLFLQEYPTLMKNVADALAQGNAHVAERSAHSLKGSVANFGAATVVDAAFTVERLSRAGDLEAARTAFAALEQELRRVHPALEQLATGTGA